MAAEKQFENKIKRYLDAQGCWYVKYFANKMTRSGVPDILACVNGYFIGIEVKAARGKASPLQFYHRDQIRKAGGVSIILYPDMFEEFKTLVGNLKTLEPNGYAFQQYFFDKGDQDA